MRVKSISQVRTIPWGTRDRPVRCGVVTGAMRDNGATRILPEPASGRVYRSSTPVRLGDASPSGRFRLDGVARALQDVATDDDADRGDLGGGAWVVRRTLLEQRSPARLDDRVELSTWCTGLGSRWAERTTALRTAGGARIDTVTLWVHLDATTGRPAKLPDAFVALYAEPTAGREVTARQEHEPVALDGDGVVVADWWPRATDLDVLDHTNNAIAWAVVEQVCDSIAAAGGVDSMLEGSARVEVEFRDPVGADAVRSGSPLRVAHLVDDEIVSITLWSNEGDHAHVTARVATLRD